MPNALVTGASAGLGAELVRQLVRDRGMTVLATARRRDRLEALAAELPPGRVLIEPGDLADEAFRSRLWDRALELPGGLDVLINNAALGHYAEFAREDLAMIRRMIDVNIVALLDLTGRAAAAMSARGQGQIVQVSSVLGFIGLPYSATYVATKHAVNGLVKSLRYELRGTGVRVWAACPGRFTSEFHGVALGQPGGSPTVRATPSEPTERVARGIVRGLDRRGGFVFPTWTARATVAATSWLPGPYDWLMGRWGRAIFRREIEQGGHAVPEKSS